MMTGKERLLSTLRGMPVDRAPIYLREGFNIAGDMFDEPIPQIVGKGVDYEFMLTWKKEKIYSQLFNYVNQFADAIWHWDIGDYLNRFLMIPPKNIKRKTTQIDADIFQIEGEIKTPKGKLSYIDHVKKGINTYWQIKPLVEDIQDLKKLAAVPFDFDPNQISKHIENFDRRYKELGDRGIMQLFISSPIVTISGAMNLETFLIMSVLERDFFHELLEELTNRIITIIEYVFSNYDIDTTADIGGSEQCTPPLMAPNAYDEYVLPYDGRIVEKLKQYGVLVNIHCHGHVKHALNCMIDMGADSTDPVEPPPAGDVEYKEARDIANGKLTLVGNLEFDELENSDREHIRYRINKIMSYGVDRLILCASAGPISKITKKMADNYRAWIDTVVEASQRKRI